MFMDFIPLRGRLLGLVCMFSLGFVARAEAEGYPWLGSWSRDSNPGRAAAAGGAGGQQGSAEDPVGDTFGMGAIQHDLVLFAVQTTGSDLVITMKFVGEVGPPMDLQDEEAVVGIIALDSDQNAATGSDEPLEGICGEDTGYDYAVVFGFEFDGERVPVGVFSATQPGPPEFEIFETVSYRGNTMEITVPLSSIGGDDGIVNARVAVGTSPEPTDCAPNGELLTSTKIGAVPGFGVWNLIVAAGLALAGGIYLLSRRGGAAANAV